MVVGDQLGTVVTVIIMEYMAKLLELMGKEARALLRKGLISEWARLLQYWGYLQASSNN